MSSTCQRFVLLYGLHATHQMRQVCNMKQEHEKNKQTHKLYGNLNEKMLFNMKRIRNPYLNNIYI